MTKQQKLIKKLKKAHKHTFTVYGVKVEVRFFEDFVGYYDGDLAALGAVRQAKAEKALWKKIKAYAHYSSLKLVAVE